MSESATAVRSALTWFEIPIAAFERACRFYETILEASLNVHQFGPARIAVFPYDEPASAGASTSRRIRGLQTEAS
jgi:predicted enzyme related to lactoylglutathione lyase